MAGGNMRVQTRPVGTIGMANQVETIDAHALRAGNFTEARNVGGQNVWMTPQGAEAYDALQRGGWEMRASKDPGWFSRTFMGDFVGAKGEQHQGRVR